MNINLEPKFRNIKIILTSVWIFLFINSISLNSVPSLTSSRIAFLFLFLIFFIRFLRKPVISKNRLLIFFSIISISIYSLLLIVLNGADFTQFSRILHFSLFSILTTFLLVHIIKSEIHFHNAVVFATLTQVIFVFMTYTSREFNELLFSIVLANNNFGESLGRAPGLSSSGGATLSVTLALGAFSVLRLARINYEMWHLPVMLLIVLSNVLVGRTGLLISSVALILFLFQFKLNTKSFVLLFLLVGVLWIYVLDVLLKNDQFINYTLNWAISAFSGDGTYTALLRMGIPEMTTIQLLFGCGWVSLPNGLNASGSDSGYVQTIFALGIVVGLLFYFFIFLLLTSYVKYAKDKTFAILVCLVPFVIEFKEPFIFKYTIVFYALSSLIYLKNIRFNEIK